VNLMEERIDDADYPDFRRITLVDVLQRVSQHPATRVAELTPRLWNMNFATIPLHSDLTYLPGAREALRPDISGAR
jgi:hypothetical protein